jgi:hypothetical protein
VKLGAIVKTTPARTPDCAAGTPRCLLVSTDPAAAQRLLRSLALLRVHGQALHVDECAPQALAERLAPGGHQAGTEIDSDGPDLVVLLGPVWAAPEALSRHVLAGGGLLHVPLPNERPRQPGWSRAADTEARAAAWARVVTAREPHPLVQMVAPRRVLESAPAAAAAAMPAVVTADALAALHTLLLSLGLSPAERRSQAVAALPTATACTPGRACLAAWDGQAPATTGGAAPRPGRVVTLTEPDWLLTHCEAQAHGVLTRVEHEARQRLRQFQHNLVHWLLPAAQRHSHIITTVQAELLRYPLVEWCGAGFDVSRRELGSALIQQLAEQRPRWHARALAEDLIATSPGASAWAASLVQGQEPGGLRDAVEREVLGACVQHLVRQRFGQPGGAGGPGRSSTLGAAIGAAVAELLAERRQREQHHSQWLHEFKLAPVSGRQPTTQAASA